MLQWCIPVIRLVGLDDPGIEVRQQTHIDNVIHDCIEGILNLPDQLLCLHDQLRRLLFSRHGISRRDDIVCELADLVCEGDGFFCRGLHGEVRGQVCRFEVQERENALKLET